MSTPLTFAVHPLGDSALVIDLGQTVSEEVNDRVLELRDWFIENRIPGVRDLVPAYNSLTLYFDPYIIINGLSSGKTAFQFLREKAEEAWNGRRSGTARPSRLIEIPVCYDPGLGYDLKLVAAARSITVEELIELHSAQTYRVYMIGFLPGFPYMGRLHEKLLMPRKSVPRTAVAPGSVGITGWQTGIYPLESPGGWQIIGRTPFQLFDASRKPSALLQTGDHVKFYSISIDEFNSFKSPEWPSR